MLDWTGLEYQAETLGSGLHDEPTEDNIRLFPWQDGWILDTEKSGQEPP